MVKLTDKEKETKFTKKEYEKLFDVLTEDHVLLVRWLLEKHPKVWHQYEDEKMGGKRLMMLKKVKKNGKRPIN